MSVYLEARGTKSIVYGRRANRVHRSSKSLVFTEIHIKIIKHLLKCCVKHILVVASKRQTYRF